MRERKLSEQEPEYIHPLGAQVVTQSTIVDKSSRYRFQKATVSIPNAFFRYRVSLSLTPPIAHIGALATSFSGSSSNLLSIRSLMNLSPGLRFAHLFFLLAAFFARLLDGHL